MGIVYLLAAALIYSTMPVLIRSLNTGHLPPISQVFLRYVFAFLAAAIYFVVTRSDFKVKRKDLPLLIFISIFGYALTNLFFTYGVLLTQVSTALFIFYCFGVVTPVLGIIFLKEKFNNANLLALVLGFLALLLLFTPTGLPGPKIGAVFALLSALAQSSYLVGRKILSGYSSKLILLSSTSLGVLTTGILALTLERKFYSGVGGILEISSRTWLVTVIFGLLNFMAWFLMSKGFQTVKATTGGLVLLLENGFFSGHRMLLRLETHGFA